MVCQAEGMGRGVVWGLGNSACLLGLVWLKSSGWAVFWGRALGAVRVCQIKVSLEYHLEK